MTAKRTVSAPKQMAEKPMQQATAAAVQRIGMRI
jgi:hypothetical protein